MPRLTNAVSQGHLIRSIIFDFGGVICNIDIKQSEKAFRNLGFKGFNSSYSVEEHEDVFRLLEGGKITVPEFIGILKKHLNPSTSDQDVLNAWNAMILDIPPERVRLLEKLRKEYRIFILSNSNQVHYEKYLGEFREKYGYDSFESIFEKAWFSYRIHLQKPGREIFEFVLKDGNLKKEETLFIDDSLQHIEAAAAVGLRTYHLQHPTEIPDLFK